MPGTLTPAAGNAGITIPEVGTPEFAQLAEQLLAAAEEARAHEVRTQVVSSRPLDAGQLEQVAAFATERFGARVTVDDLDNVVDESLIMGIKLVRGDQVIDGSLSRRISDLRQTMHI